jgi:O-antigen ligase
MAAGTQRWARVLAGLLGVAMALVLVKIGNPVIFKSMETPPSNIWEFIFATWPTIWGYFILAAICAAAFSAEWKRISRIPTWLVMVLSAWLLWVILSSRTSVAPDLSSLTCLHLGATVTIFFIGGVLLPSLTEARIFFRILIFGFAFALWTGIDQHYGGLEATRKAFYALPNWESFPPEYKLKIASNRIFGPFIYPNTFAGAILIWGPVLTLALWGWTQRVPSVAQKVIVGIFIYMMAACFFWTGSKAGWLIAIAVAVAALLHLNLKRSVRIGIIVAVVAFGLAGFAFKFRNYFAKGATSASARVIYWKAAVQIANEHPVFGAGPGTFAKSFSPIKPEGAEMARLTHNDYLEQACDSGWPAFLLYLAFVFGALKVSHQAVRNSPLHLAAWLGVLGWALQSFVEFGLYIPAISWSAFILMGWLAADRIPIDTPKPAH